MPAGGGGLPLTRPVTSMPALAAFISAVASAAFAAAAAFAALAASAADTGADTTRAAAGAATDALSDVGNAAVLAGGGEVIIGAAVCPTSTTRMVAERLLRAAGDGDGDGAAAGDGDDSAGDGVAFFGKPAAAFGGGGWIAGLGDGLAAALDGGGECCKDACTGLGLDTAGALLPGLLLLAPPLLLEMALLLVAETTGFAAPVLGGGCDVANACFVEVAAFGAAAAHGSAKEPTEHPEESHEVAVSCTCMKDDNHRQMTLLRAYEDIIRWNVALDTCLHSNPFHVGISGTS